ncbi:MAG TPA: imidazole glycerol phosphate synthase subunit HisH [Chloroflexi bacterium]|nr:imidazole glycerol phosphate synthase subunit HisH [Chloroflexota bacterium]HBY07881.1 imidazole glycerol phosphate synthase subunit HisH [Chloroflexota bacterium]
MITIVDYNAGNLTSVKRALEHLGIANQISADPEVVRRSERIIFPGVGHARAAMEVLQTRGLDSALKEAFGRGTPILGICIGCQIILAHSEEGDTPGLNLIPGVCAHFQFQEKGLKVPHMGWNTVTVTQNHPVLAHLKPGDSFYFVHSYYPQPAEASHVFATCDYGFNFPVAIGVENLFALQFHAEKSGPLGLRVLENFARWTPC